MRQEMFKPHIESMGCLVVVHEGDRIEVFELDNGVPLVWIPYLEQVPGVWFTTRIRHTTHPLPSRKPFRSTVVQTWLLIAANETEQVTDVVADIELYPLIRSMKGEQRAKVCMVRLIPTARNDSRPISQKRINFSETNRCCNHLPYKEKIFGKLMHNSTREKCSANIGQFITINTDTQLVFVRLLMCTKA